MSRLFQHRRAVWFVLIGGLLLLLTFIAAMQSPRAELLTRAPDAKKPRLAFLGSWGGPVRVTWRNLRTRLLGPARTVAISAEIFECHDSFSLATVLLPAPVAVDQISTRMWLLETNQLIALRNNMASNVAAMTRSHVWTADGQPAKVFTGESVAIGGASRWAGVELDALARTRGSAVDLTAFFTLTGAFTNFSTSPNAISIRTNLAIGARLQIPRDHHAFLLTSNPANGKRFGMILSARINEPKK